MVLSFRSLIVLCAVVLIIACQRPAPSEKGPLEGAWKRVESSLTAPDTSSTITSPQPSLFLFAKQHYSYLFVPGTQPRALYKERFEPTDAERLAAYNSFVANSGTYEITESTITIRPIVARNPNFMAGEFLLTYVYRVQGDSLWLTLTSPPWAPEAELRMTLVRLE